jgi:hypothetical protein
MRRRVSTFTGHLPFPSSVRRYVPGGTRPPAAPPPFAGTKCQHPLPREHQDSAPGKLRRNLASPRLGMQPRIPQVDRPVTTRSARRRIGWSVAPEQNPCGARDVPKGTTLSACSPSTERPLGPNGAKSSAFSGSVPDDETSLLTELTVLARLPVDPVNSGWWTQGDSNP